MYSYFTVFTISGLAVLSEELVQGRHSGHRQNS